MKMKINLLWKSCGFDANLFVLLNKMWNTEFENERENGYVSEMLWRAAECTANTQ